MVFCDLYSYSSTNNLKYCNRKIMRSYEVNDDDLYSSQRQRPSYQHLFNKYLWQQLQNEVGKKKKSFAHDFYNDAVTIKSTKPILTLAF